MTLCHLFGEGAIVRRAQDPCSKFNRQVQSLGGDEIDMGIADRVFTLGLLVVVVVMRGLNVFKEKKRRAVLYGTFTIHNGIVGWYIFRN